MKIQLLIPAAGMGRRLGYDQPKALVPLAGNPLLLATLARLRPLSCDAPVIVVVPPHYEQAFSEALGPYRGLVHLVHGGNERRDSVACGLAALDTDTEIVVIHDAARPFPPVESIRTAIEAANTLGAATLALPVSDTILLEDGNSFLKDTPDRACVWACQTPQVFRTSVIREAYARQDSGAISCTDDATLVRLAGFPVRLVSGHALNFKITNKLDLMFAEHLLERGLL